MYLSHILTCSGMIYFTACELVITGGRAVEKGFTLIDCYCSAGKIILYCFVFH